MAGSNEKIYTIFAGINGAGKSTLYYTLGEGEFGVRLNSDELLAISGGDWKNTNDQFHAGKEVLSIQQECFDKGLPMNRETTIGGVSIDRSIRIAREKGYTINLYYVGVDSLELAKERVKKRVVFGGHGVNDSIMDTRYKILNKSIARLINKCDSVKFYDNSSDGIEMVAFSYNQEFIKVRNNLKWLDEILEQVSIEREYLAENTLNNE